MTDAPAPTPAPRPSLGRASALIASGTIVSRVLGFVNATLLAATIGLVGQGANAFSVANTLPNSVFWLIAGGLLSSVLVPQIVRAASHDDGGQRFVNKVVTLGLSIFFLVTLAATLAAPALIFVLTGLSGGGTDRALGPAGIQLAIAMAYWCLPQVFFYACYSMLTEVLNARGVFGPFAWAPVINNLVLMATIVTFGAIFGLDPAHRDPASWSPLQITVLAGGATLGVALQAVFLTLFWRRTGLSFRPDFRWRGVGLSATAKNAGWAFGIVIANQLAGIAQSNVAVHAGQNDPASYALSVMWAIFVLPHSLLTISFATPYFTRMATHAHEERFRDLATDLSSSLRLVVLLTTGAGAAIAAASLPFAEVFANSQPEIGPAAVVLVAYLLGLPAFSAIYLVHRGFYALGDTRTPFIIQAVQAALFIGMALAALLLPGHFIGAGLALAITVADGIQTLVIALLLRRRLRRLEPTLGGGVRVVQRFVVYVLAAIPSIAVGLVVLWALGGVDPSGLASFWTDAGSALAGHGFAMGGKLPAIVSIVVVGLASLAVYVGVLATARVPELAAVGGAARRILNRLRRR